MDQELLKALRCGNGFHVKVLVRQDPNLLSGMSPQGNTVLHMAIRFGNHSVLQEILKLQPSLLYRKNRKGDTPLHIAARAGDAGSVTIIMDYMNTIIVESEAESILRKKDNEGNTPLHNAVRNNHENVVQMLVEKDDAPVLYVNSAGQSPLSIAIDANLNGIASFIINKFPDSLNHRGPEELTLLHSAVIRQNYDIMVKMLETKRELVELLDWYWRNPLHYAAASGHVKMAQHLAVENTSLAYQGDRDGQTPLHLAAENGQLSVLKMLLNDYPDAIEILDNRRRSLLHLAAQYGNVNVVLFILKSPDIEDLINLPDEDGNTPLHLAAMNFQSDVVYILSRNTRVDIRAKNFSDSTAVAIVESSKDHEKDIQKHLTLKALKVAYAKRALYPEDILENRRFAGIEEINQGGIGTGKEMAQTLSVMATLIATFTFTAAFTIPGGFKNDGPDEGMATLVRKTGFRAFVITDTIAMTSSMTAAVIVFWSFWRSKTESFMDTLPLAIGLTWIGLVSMALAFVTGLFVVLSNDLALAIVVCSIGCILPITFYVFAPFFMILFDQNETNPFAFILRFVRILCKSF